MVFQDEAVPPKQLPELQELVLGVFRQLQQPEPSAEQMAQWVDYMKSQWINSVSTLPRTHIAAIVPYINTREKQARTRHPACARHGPWNAAAPMPRGGRVVCWGQWGGRGIPRAVCVRRSPPPNH